MAKVLVDSTNLTAIANAIRAKNGGTSVYKPSQMATAISALGVVGDSSSLATTISQLSALFPANAEGVKY